MKYIVMLGDGMADYPIEKLGKKTPLDVAYKPNIDKMAKKSILGMVKTVPNTMKPGSDVANLAAMGYDPEKCYTGRAPLEAVSMGINLSDTDVAFRCNIVTLSEKEQYENKVMTDYSAGEISTKEAAQLIEAVKEAFQSENISFYSGISYRHCMVWKNGPLGLDLIPPHDISDRKIMPYLPKNKTILDFMKGSFDILKNHPINLERKKRGLHAGNAIWLWGEGTKPAVSNFYETYGVNGSVISAVDLIKGIGMCAGFHVVDVPGATGNIDTNFKAKGEAALKELLDGKDFVYIHVEAPDECGHRGEIENKIYSIEMIDKDIVGPLIKGLEKAQESYCILVLPDHPTPIALKTHVSDPIPFMLYKSHCPVESGFQSYNEASGRKAGLYIEKGCELMQLLLED